MTYLTQANKLMRQYQTETHRVDFMEKREAFEEINANALLSIAESLVGILELLEDAQEKTDEN